MFPTRTYVPCKRPTYMDDVDVLYDNAAVNLFWFHMKKQESGVTERGGETEMELGTWLG